jgi:hypothetical protein
VRLFVQDLRAGLRGVLIETAALVGAILLAIIVALAILAVL